MEDRVEGWEMRLKDAYIYRYPREACTNLDDARNIAAFSWRWEGEGRCIGEASLLIHSYVERYTQLWIQDIYKFHSMNGSAMRDFPECVSSNLNDKVGCRCRPRPRTL